MESTNFKTFGVSGDVPDIMASLISFSENQEILNKHRALDVEKKRSEIKHNQELKACTETDLRSKLLLKEQQQCLSNTNEVSLLKLKEETDNLKDDIQKYDDEKQNFLESLESRSQILVKRFSSAPECYNIKTISEKISRTEKEIHNSEMKIWEEYDPDILTSHTEMEKETLTFLEIPGYATTELTPKDLQILNDKLQENSKHFHQGIEEAMRETEQLHQEENSLD